MKKTKILIPALSIASVGAVVAPVVTSCKTDSAALLGTSDINYVGQVHELVEGDKNAWDVAKAHTEYFKDQTVNFLTQDIVTASVKSLHSGFVEKHERYKNVNYNFCVSIDKLTIGEEKTVTITRSSGDVKDVKGYLVSGSFTVTSSVSYDVLTTDAEKIFHCSSVHSSEDKKMTITFKNCFASIGYDSGWKVYVEGAKNAAADWEYEKVYSENSNTTKTLLSDGTTFSLPYSHSEKEIIGAKYGFSDQSILEENNISSNYLSKVAYKAPTK